MKEITNKIISLKNEIDTNNTIIDNRKNKLKKIKAEEKKILEDIANLEFEQLVLNKIIKKEKEKLINNVSRETNKRRDI